MTTPPAVRLFAGIRQNLHLDIDTFISQRIVLFAFDMGITDKRPTRPMMKKRHTMTFDRKILSFPTLTFKGFFDDLETDTIAAVVEMLGTTMFLLIGLGVSSINVRSVCTADR